MAALKTIGLHDLAKITMPRRSRRYGVGKEIGGAVYLHRDYETLLGQVVDEARACLPDDFSYTVVKYQSQSRQVDFIAVPDFDQAPEPLVGDRWIVLPGGRTQFRPMPVDPFLFHHKWLFVADDYPGFSVTDSQARSRGWMTLEGIDIHRIGRRSYWKDVVLPHLDGYSNSVSAQR